MSRTIAELRALVRERDGDNCWVCGEPIDFSLPPGGFMGASLEHVRPRAAGGMNDLANLRLSHARPCNNERGADYGGYAAKRQSRRATADARHGARVLRRSERDRQYARARTGARERRGPWGGLVVVEERGPWGGIVRVNYARPGARSMTA